MKNIQKLIVIIFVFCIGMVCSLVPANGVFADTTETPAVTDPAYERASEARDMFVNAMYEEAGIDPNDGDNRAPDYFGYVCITSNNQLKIAFYNIPDKTLAYFKEKLKGYADIVVYAEAEHSENQISDYFDELSKQLESEGYVCIGGSISDIGTKEEPKAKLLINLASTDKLGNPITDRSCEDIKDYKGVPVEIRITGVVLPTPKPENVVYKKDYSNFPVIPVVIGGIVLFCAGIGIGILIRRRLGSAKTE